jgi:hypothetical protein
MDYWLESGGDWELLNNVGHGVVHKSCWRGHVDMLEYLWKRFVVNYEEAEMSSATAATNRQFFKAPDFNGFTPYQIARFAGGDTGINVCKWFEDKGIVVDDDVGFKLEDSKYFAQDLV